ncbi:MAG: hypothetical protein HQM08_00035 [Candidatus Riflebacteria bacterium]|nr:hypothetical protein [Candidatus Riflebacteria bacterium]
MKKRFFLLLISFFILTNSVFASQKRIGIFPGSFDPIHNSHLRIAVDAISKLKLDKLIFVPNFSQVDKSISDLQTRVFLIKRALTVINNPKIEVLSVGNPESENAPAFQANPSEYLIELVISKYPKDKIFHILGSDSIGKMEESSDFKRLGENYQLVIKSRQEKSSLPERIRNSTLANFVNFLPDYKEESLSSTNLRKACSEGNLKELFSETPFPVAAEIILSGMYGVASTSEWLEGIIEVARRLSDCKKFDESQLVLPFHTIASESDKLDSYSVFKPSEQVKKIDFSVSHSLSNLRDYVQQKFTPLGLKILSKPDLEIFVFAGSEKSLHAWLRSQGVLEGALVTRSRSKITTTLLIGKARSGKHLAVIPGIYGTSRELQTQALLACALYLHGRPTDSFSIVKSSDSLDYSEVMKGIYRKCLEKVIPETVDAAIIGFHWKVLNNLARRVTLFRVHPSKWAIRDSKINEKWLKLKQNEDLLAARPPDSWPQKHFTNEDLPHTIAAFSDSMGKPKTLLLTQSVYGDQINALMDILVNEKKIRKIFFFGSCGALASDSQIGEVIVPKEVSDLSGTFTLSENVAKKPEWARVQLKTGKVFSVFSPLQETNDFLGNLRKNGFDAVDVELSHFAKFLKSQKKQMIDYKVYLVFSDLPGRDFTLEKLPGRERELEPSISDALDIILNDLDYESPG